MSFLLLLFISLTWMAGASEPSVRSVVAPDFAIPLFLGTLLSIVLIVATWSRLLARRVSGPTFSRSLQRLGRIMLLSRFFVVAWFATGVFALGWVDFVLNHLHLAWFETARLPALVVGISPAVLAWVGLWWAHYPADTALRQQGLAENLMDGLPIHSPPRLGQHLLSNFRIQVLFVLMPMMMIVAVRDLTLTAIHLREGPAAVGSTVKPRTEAEIRTERDNDIAEAVIWFLSAGIVYLVAPEILRRVLHTSPMVDGPLRRRLESLCRRSGMSYRDILIWHTHFNVGNAAVMGLLPRFRYILLSDLLLERMDDDQIEAVFAHEIGHIVHRHMAWIIVLVLILMFCFAAMAQVFQAITWLNQLPISQTAWAVISLTAASLAFWIIYGFLSRRFERQADVYAARMLEAARPASAADGAAALAPLMSGETQSARSGDLVPQPHPVDSHVGTYGAQLFASALHRVAMINNLPVHPRSRRGVGLKNQVSHVAGNLMDLAYDWLHGSIAGRMEYLRTLSDDPALTTRFDRIMTRLYGTLLFALIASAAYVVPSLMR